MFGIGSTELLLILVVALIVLGPKSLASVSRSLGKAVGEFRRVSTDFQRALNVEAAKEEAKQAAHNAQPGAKVQTDMDKLHTRTTSESDDEIPPDSPLAQAIAKAKAQAAKSDDKTLAKSSDPNLESHGA